MERMVIGLGLIGLLIIAGCVEEQKAINSFEDCVEAGNPVMESYPRQCMTAEGKNFVEEINQDKIPKELLDIAESSECTGIGTLSNSSYYNPNSKTWWIDIQAEKPSCSPACVIFEENKSVEINWRCTGVIVP